MALYQRNHFELHVPDYLSKAVGPDVGPERQGPGFYSLTKV